MSDDNPKNKWTTKRVAFSAAGFITATVALWNSKLDGGNWVFALAVVIAGHHAEDLIRAYRGKEQ
jgi:hypothetical protein